ncbi:hypothetical protein C8Q78DRAFT_995086 [Trametes maxima]|nr:hypothetical protein C8Q78DRAFT_995086 [Trametes maxima]
MFVPITLKRKSGKVVKSWELNGAHNIEEVLQFIWRDLFLSLLATGSQKQIQKIPDMLDDIEELMGWTALERLLFGGRKCPHDIEECPDEDPYAFDTESDIDEDEDAFTDEDSDLDQPVANEDWLPKISQEGATTLYSKHWSHRISSQMQQFRLRVQTAMIEVFKVTPSLRLFSALLSNSPDRDTTEAELLSHLSEMATSCPETFAAALDIYASVNNTDAIASLLKTHTHLVRPRDAVALQSAVNTMGANPTHQQRALEMIEKELLDTAHAVRVALLGPFSLLETPENRTEIEQILKLRQASAGRQDRVERWVDAVSTPGMNAPNPMALAAMVMGLPIVPAMDGTEDADPLGYLDLDPQDPDMEDLRDEFRPRLKQRFEGWADTAITVRGASVVLLKVYRELMQTMPFLRASDVVEDMAGRLADKPSKQYLVDAVDALSAFVRVQRRKAQALKAEQKRRANAAAQTNTGSLNHTPVSTSTFTSTPSTSTSASASTSTYVAPTVADVADSPPSRPETPPPPLEPAMPAPPPPAAPAPLFTLYTGHVTVPLGPGGPAVGGPFGPGGAGFAGAFGAFGAGGLGGGFADMDDVD